MKLDEARDIAWQPCAALSMLTERAGLLDRMRGFFRVREVLEVETPVLSAAGTPSPMLESFRASYRGPGVPGGRNLYLHTSPEFAMKRLLAAGSGSIYQICKVFRNGEAGTLHNPEFTLLEWYRVGFDATQLMDEVEAFMRDMLARQAQPAEYGRLAYRELFQRYAGVDGLEATVADLQACLRSRDIGCPAGLAATDLDGWRDLVLSEVIVPQLVDEVLFVYDYPASQAALARLRPGSPSVAQRFELYWRGLELANGFCELTSAREQSQRFTLEEQQRRERGLPAVDVDSRFLAALQSGLPDCSGVAVGVDRLLMVATGKDDIRDVLAFPIDRA
jgi:lysyl-tRNA synthetase class 2